jgi:hypothetical protein
MCVFLNPLESSPHMNLKFLMLITYICPARLQLSNGKCLPMQQETWLHLNGFPLGCFDCILCVTMITSAWWIDALKSHSYVRPMAYNNWQPLWLPKVKSYISRFWVLTSFWWVYRRNTSTYIYCTCLEWRNHCWASINFWTYQPATIIKSFLKLSYQLGPRIRV